MQRSQLRMVVGGTAALLGLFSAACGGDSSSATTMGGGGAGGGTQQSLYAKYGGAPTVKKVVAQAIAGLTADQKVSAFFAGVGSPGQDSAEDLTGCLELFFTAALGGPATYPGKLEDGFVCRSMTEAHANLGVTSAAFDEFVMDLGGVLKSDGVSDEDISTIAGSLNGLKVQVVSKKPQSLYDKYGGYPTVKKIVGQAVAGLTSDEKIAPFFAVVGTKGHDSAEDLTGCLEAFFSNALGGPGQYPTKLADGFVCRDMKAAHTGLDIDSEAFDEFIMDLGGVLQEDKVEQKDIDAIAGALTGLKAQVVTK